MKEQDLNKYAHLDQLSTQELREILQADIDSPESGDDEAIMYIVEVMKKRERKDPSHDPSSDLDRCWNEFQTLYHTPEGAGRSLYPTGEQEHNARPVVRRPGRRVRRIILAAAVLVLLVATLAVPVAGHASILEMLGVWTEEQFTIQGSDAGPGGATKDFEGAQIFENTVGDELRAVLAEHGITENVVPRWMPEGVVIAGDVLIQESVASPDEQFFVLYSDGTHFISITIINHVGGIESRIYEKAVDSPDTYLAGNIEHYIFNNTNSIGAVWYVDNLECSIDTTLSQQDLEKVLNSIYEE